MVASVADMGPHTPNGKGIYILRIYHAYFLL